MTGNDDVRLTVLLHSLNNFGSCVHTHKCANPCIGARYVLVERRSTYSVHLNIYLPREAVLRAYPYLRLLSLESFLILTNGHKLINYILHRAARIALHESIHLLLRIALCQHICRGVEGNVAYIKQLCHITHLCAVT